MSTKISLKEATLRLKNHPQKIVILEYYSINSLAKFECLDCGNVWEALAANVINRKSFCPECANIERSKKHSFSYEHVFEYVKKKGCELLSKDYTNNSIKLDIKYPCGHINNLSFANFKRDFGCRKCWEKRGYVDKYSIDDIREILEENDLEFIDFPNGYINGNSDVVYSCSSGHITIRDLKYVIKFPTCKVCKIKERSYNQRGENGNNWKGGVTEITMLIRGRLSDWRKKSLEEYGNKCYITGFDFDVDVHHLYSFKSIFYSVIEDLSKHKNNKIDFLNLGDIDDIISKTIEKHYEIGLGVPLYRKAHILFHKIYGKENNTPEQFYEFVDRIESGEIIINK